MNEQIKRVAIYGRVSTEGQNVDLQLAELNDFIAKRGWRRWANTWIAVCQGRKNLDPHSTN
jgi:DNA invertase Pin-like site-specific DNA recombinase